MAIAMMIVIGTRCSAAAAAASQPSDLQVLMNQTSPPSADAAKEEIKGPGNEPEKRPTLVLNEKSLDARYKWAVGINYLGGQVRYHMTPRYAAELRYQTGTADSDYGHVRAEVQGLRIYRFIPYRQAWRWYLGGEGAHAAASSDQGGYQTNGFAIGAYGGMEYRVLPRFAIDIDMGPYLISLREKRSHLSETNLDFVINTAFTVYLF